MAEKTSLRKRRRSGAAGCVHRLLFILAVAAGMVVFLCLGQNLIETKTYEVKLSRLPEAFDGYKIVLVSDLHAKQYGKDNEALIRLIRAQQPDLIAVAGDLCHGADEAGVAVSFCKQIASIAPVYYVFGNHEWAGRVVPELKTALKDSGVDILQNQYVTLTRGEQSICLLGLEDLNGPYDMKSITQVVTGLRENEGDPFILTLSHRFDRFEEYAQHRLDVVLSGHSHGGIIRLPFTDGLIAPGRTFFPKYTSGKYTLRDTVMVVSRGLGNSANELRVFNPPHLPVVILKKQ